MITSPFIPSQAHLEFVQLLLKQKSQESTSPHKAKAQQFYTHTTIENVTVNVSHDHWSFSQLSVHNLKYFNVCTASFTIVYSLIFVLGFLGNVIVISAISSNSQMRTMTNIFVCNLAAADLLVVLFCVPVTLAANIFILEFL